MAANTRKRPKGEFTHLERDGILFERDGKIEIMLVDHTPFKVRPGDLAAVLYGDGQWGYGLIKPGAKIRELQLATKIVKEQQLA
jgi:hypothetical protein